MYRLVFEKLADFNWESFKLGLFISVIEVGFDKFISIEIILSKSFLMGLNLV